MYVIMGALHTTPCLYLQFNKGNLPSIELYYLIVSRINHKNKDTHITDEETKYAPAENCGVYITDTTFFPLAIFQSSSIQSDQRLV